MSLVYPIILSGKQGSGKSTTTEKVAAILKGEGLLVFPYKFAKPLYEMHDAILPILKSYGLVSPETTKVGRILQLLGTEGGRDLFGQDVWVNCSKVYLKTCEELTLTLGKDGVLLIDDCRFKNELNAFKDEGFTVRLEADRDIRKARTDAWRDTENHISEIDLDENLKDFNLVVRTDMPQFDLDTVAATIMDAFKAWKK